MEEAQAISAGNHVDGVQELAEVAADAGVCVRWEKRGRVRADVREDGEQPGAVVVKDCRAR